MLETIKAHPYITAGVGIGGVLVLYMLSSGGSSASYVPVPNADSTAVGSDLQAANLAAQTQMASIAASIQGAQIGAAHDIELAKIKAQSDFDITQIQGGVALATVNANKEVGIQQNTLLAQIEGAKIHSEDLASSNALEANRAMLGVLTHQIDAASATAQAATKAGTRHPILEGIGALIGSIFRR